MNDNNTAVVDVKWKINLRGSGIIHFGESAHGVLEIIASFLTLMIQMRRPWGDFIGNLKL